MLASVKSIEMDGLLWGASKLIPIGYGIKKLQVGQWFEFEIFRQLVTSKQVLQDLKSQSWAVSIKFTAFISSLFPQVMCTVEDDKVSVEELTEKIEEFEDFVQSCDVNAMNKI